MKWFGYLRTTLFLSAGAGVFALLGLLVVAFWWSPISPMSRDEPVILLSDGDVKGASRAYMQQATGWGSDKEREESLWRAAQLQAIELHSRKSALELLKAFQDSWPESEHRADAFALMAELYEPKRNGKLSEKNKRARLRKAAHTLEIANQTNPEHERAGDWLVRAASIWMELDRPLRADAIWRKASNYKEHRVAALMAIANMQLADTPELAYDSFRRALKHNPDSNDATLVRLGMATALERMERYLEAEDTIDLALSEDLGDLTLSQRKRRLETIR